MIIVMENKNQKDLLFKDWAIEWLEYQRNFIKESTYGAYTTLIYNHLIPNLGEIPLKCINEKTMQNLVLFLLTNGRKDGEGGLSEKTVKCIMTILKTCLLKAKKENLMNYYEPNLIYPRTTRNQDIKVLNKRNQLQIQNAVLDNINTKSIGILFMLQTGVRIGELCALQYRDIDYEQETVTISKTIQRTFTKNSNGNNTTKIVITPPKSLSSDRKIPLSGILMRALMKLPHYDPEAYLLTGSDKYMEPRSYLNYYRKFFKETNIDYINFHGLRHTFATRCIEAGGDSKTVSELLGHSSIKITLDLYVHPQMEAKRKCVELVNLM